MLNTGDDSFMDRMNLLEKSSQFQDALNQKRESDINKTDIEKQKLNLKKLRKCQRLVAMMMKLMVMMMLKRACREKNDSFFRCRRSF